MPNSYNTLKEQFQRIARLDHAITFLQWDQLVMMPPGGNDTRSKSIAELKTMRHELLCSELLGDLLHNAQERETSPDRSRSLMEMERSRKQAISVPADLVRAQSLAGSICEHGWRKQHKQNDWPGFLTAFVEVVNLSRREAQARRDHDSAGFPTPYDALLDLYCTGDSSRFIDDIFVQLKKELPEILAKVVEKQANTEKVELLGSFPVDRQKALNCKLMEILGFDFQRGRLDVSMHPFSTGDRGDQRITTRFRETDFFEALLATAHETGHASYENGLPAEWDGLPIGRSRNMCIHESQSLLFEKQLFLSGPFLSFFTKTIHQYLPQTSRWSGNRIRSATTRVQPSLIRVEADEVTYPLHIVLRFEIEKELINGGLEAKDIPEVWDAKMQQYLGLSTAGNYREGCLQDIHWTDGSFGYFPSYTVGALNAAQLFAAITRKYPDWSERLSRGDAAFLRQWLGETIWSKGRSLESQEIMEQATGEGTNAAYFLSHLKARYLPEQA